ncbi:MAG: S8 family serine peptidase [Acidimicrobiia bacterium]
MTTHRFRRRAAILIAGALATLGFVTVSNAPAARAAPAPAPISAPVADNRLVVALEPGVPTADAGAIARDAGVNGAEVVDEHTIVVDAPPGGAQGVHAENLRDDARVRYVEPNYLISSSFTPNDPEFPSLGTLHDAQPGGIRAESAWNTTVGSRDVVVGVLDSGIDATHPDLVANLWSNRTGVGGCGYGTHGYNALTGKCTTVDLYGHGTHVSGIIGAVGNNGIGITGVAPRVSLMSLAMLDSNGNGSIAGAIAAIDWAVSARQAGVGLRILSASWGGSGFSQALTDAIQRAGNAGILFVTAAGNSHVNVDQSPVYPCAAGLANEVCVASSSSSDQLSDFSDFGATHVDLAAPGEAVMSTVPPGVIPECGQALYCALDGTSMATPMVSGAAVLAVSADPTLSVAALRARLVQAVDPVGSLAGKVVSGGRLDVCKVVPGCGSTPARPPSPPSGLAVSVVHGQATLRWSASASNGNAVGVTAYVVNGPDGDHVVGPTVRQLTVNGLLDNKNTNLSVRARNIVGDSTATPAIGRAFSGGFVVHQTGRLARIRVATGPKPSETTATELSAGSPQARGVAVMPDGTGGYVLDGSGRLHPFGIGGDPAPPEARGGRVSRASDWARGVAIMPDGSSGYVVDGSGALYGFSIGDHVRPPKTSGLPARSGDYTRGVTITPSGHGGYVVDGTGALFAFTIGSAPLPVAASGETSWPGQDMARGVAVLRAGGGGFVLDRTGGLHPFRTDGTAPGPPLSGPSWPGSDRARGLGL